MSMTTLDMATRGLTSQYSDRLTKLPNRQNSITIAQYINAMRHESNSFSDNYRKSIIKTLSLLSRFCRHGDYKSMTHDDITNFLDSHEKPVAIDPMHKWIGTYNLYTTTIVKFFKWLYYPDDSPKNRMKPKVVQNITQKKRLEVSCYKPTDLWTVEEDALFLKYCPRKRTKCYHTVSRDLSPRPGEVLKLKIRDLVFKMTPDKKQYCEVLLNEKTGSRHLALFDSIPYVKDYLEHDHPMPSNPDAPFISGETTRSIGRPLKEDALARMYRMEKKFFKTLLDKPDVWPEDKKKIAELLRKPWVPYLRRHIGLTEKSLKIPGLINQYAGWKEGSKMPQKYFHYFGNEASKGILEAYGIISKDEIPDITLSPKQCPNCSEPNKPDSRFCAKCMMVLTYDAYSETLDREQKRNNDIEIVKKRLEKYEKQMGRLTKFIHTLPDASNWKIISPLDD